MISAALQQRVWTPRHTWDFLRRCRCRWEVGGLRWRPGSCSSKIVNCYTPQESIYLAFFTPTTGSALNNSLPRPLPRPAGPVKTFHCLSILRKFYHTCTWSCSLTCWNTTWWYCFFVGTKATWVRGVTVIPESNLMKRYYYEVSKPIKDPWV